MIATYRVVGDVTAAGVSRRRTPKSVFKDMELDFMVKNCYSRKATQIKKKEPDFCRPSVKRNGDVHSLRHLRDTREPGE
jgi:hypothetical protein